MYNQKTIDEIMNTWVGELVSLSEESIEQTLDTIPDVAVLHAENPDMFLGAPVFLSDMTRFEKVLFTLLEQKRIKYADLSLEKGGDAFSPELRELHRVFSLLYNEMWESINARYPEDESHPGNGISISKGGKLFSTERKEDPAGEEMQELTQMNPWDGE